MKVCLLVADLIVLTVAIEACSENFFPSVWKRARESAEDVDHGGSEYLGKDEKSGCECRLVAGKYSFCYRRDICRTFPKNINITTSCLKVKHSGIIELKPGDLSHLTHLEILMIDGNYNLSQIWAGSFQEMITLRYLSISENANLRSLQPGSLEGLLNLQRLMLVKNAFFELALLTPALAKIPQLRYLVLSENKFRQIGKTDFEVMRASSLEELNLVLCQIEEIDPEAFNPLTNLTVLRLGENDFQASTITQVIEETIGYVPLKNLNLYSIGLNRISLRPLLAAVAKSNITDLNLSHNKLEVITSENIPKMPNLQFLDLSEVLTLNITNDAFVGLTNLRTLLLSGNKLASIPEGVLLEQLTHLDLKQNSGSRFSSSYFSIYGQKFKNMKNLKSLNLSFNAIHMVYNSSFDGLVNLTKLGLQNATIYHIADRSFAKLSKLVFLNLENNPLNHEVVLRPQVFEGLDKLEVLLLGGCGISFINKDNPFRTLRNLKHLGLNRNKLIAVEGFEMLPKLRVLDLSQNFLQPWKNRIFSKNFHLEHISAKNNKFQFLTQAMMEDFQNLTKLELADNPFTCDCSFSWNTRKIMNLLENETVFCAFPDSTTSLTIQEYLELNYNCRNLTLVLLLVFFFLFLGVLVFALYYFRWHLRYFLFLTRLYLSRKGRISGTTNKNSYTNYLYDAFVSYCNEDRNFVIRLVTMLENYPPFIKLCVYERDFEVGTIISENVLESVAKSRKTLLIISDCYAKSQWCRWESQIAEHHRLFFQNENGEYVDDSLILIKLGPVSEAHLTPTLKYLLKTRIYLQWDSDAKKQKVFWEKLRAALAPPIEVNENTHL